MKSLDTPKFTSPDLKEIFKTFLYLGLTAFGGLLMIVNINKKIVKEKQWFSDKEFLDGLALCQTIPGATIIQLCSYIGLKLQGISGAAVSLVGFMAPSFLFIIFFSYFYILTKGSDFTKDIFMNLQTVVVALMIQASFVIGKMNIKNSKSFLIAIIGTILFWLKFSSFMTIFLSAILGLFLFNNIKVNLKQDSTVEGRYVVFKNLKSILFMFLILTSVLLFSFFYNKHLYNLSSSFVKISIVSFGSGYSGTSLMFKEIVEKYHLISPQTFLDGMIFGRVTPGPGMVSVFIGFVTFGILGAVIAMISIYLPALIVLITVEPIFSKLKNFWIFQRIIMSILSSFVGLLINVTFTFATLISWDIKQFVILVASFTALSLKVSPLWVILTTAIVSIVLNVFMMIHI
ncbi:chromate transporter [Thermodesulfobium acidiphilum]|uniref:Chromate transporter n=1 Tax=Thermodesulfobium acidiphilum TaxID=1794699 RepID=A0A2R4W0X2_THEAF|nr:chromate efflux transporter [Thermodesulfobium acidiphilum]AWB10364.1 chromate transporter [Thermodesulfobium acidiphilum]